MTQAINFRTRANQKLRADVYARDDYTCQGCGWRPTEVPEHYDGQFTIWTGEILHVDHVVPRALGGPSTIENLQTLCGSCNSSKCSHLDWAGRA